MTSRKRILITGGAGFIGSHVADKYVHDHEVMILDDLRTGYTENIPDGVWLQRIDVNDRRRLRDAFRAFKPHLVSHHAAQLEISKGYENPVEEAEEDLLATIRVLEESRRAGVQHFVYASSACCYAPDGSRELDPQWTYGAAKLAGEHYAQIYSRYMCMTVFRYGIVFGPREWYGRVLTNFVTRLLEHEPPVVFGDGTARRDFAYVLDAAEMHRTVTDMAASGVFDVGSGVSTSVLDLAKALTTFARRKRLPGASDAIWPDARYTTEEVQQGGQSTLMPGRMRLPDEMAYMSLLPDTILGGTRGVFSESALESYFEYAAGNPIQWQSRSYRI